MDRHHRDVTFQVGDLVYVRLRPYRQLSLRPHYSKLSKRFYGPFSVIEKIGSVAYHLQLPENSKIHPMFHVSILKPHHSPPPDTADTLPPEYIDHHPVVEPLSLLDLKWNLATTPPFRMVMVQWRGLALEETSWEDWATLRSAYNLEDEVAFPGEGVDSNRAQVNSRPRRTIRKPAHYKDFV